LESFHCIQLSKKKLRVYLLSKGKVECLFSPLGSQLNLVCLSILRILGRVVKGFWCPLDRIEVIEVIYDHTRRHDHGGWASSNDGLHEVRTLHSTWIHDVMCDAREIPWGTRDWSCSTEYILKRSRDGVSHLDIWGGRETSRGGRSWKEVSSVRRHGRKGGGIHRNKESSSEKRGQSGPMLYRTEGEGSFLNNKKLYNPLDN
jgi:hypothetical protein